MNLDETRWQPVLPNFTPAPAKPRSKKKLLLIAGGATAIIIAAAIGLTMRGTSSPAYVNQLTSDGYTLANQSTLSGGSGVGYAYGVNQRGYAELVVQSKTPQEAQSLQQLGQNLGQGGSVTTVTNGTLAIIDGTKVQIAEIVSSAGWS